MLKHFSLVHNHVDGYKFLLVVATSNGVCDTYQPLEIWSSIMCLHLCRSFLFPEQCASQVIVIWAGSIFPVPLFLLLFADHIYRCWQPSCSRTEAIIISSSGILTFISYSFPLKFCTAPILLSLLKNPGLPYTLNFWKSLREETVV